MSIRITTAVWEHSRAKGRARLVLLALADHADDDGRAWPSVARLARYTLMDVRNVHRALTKLIEEGEIVATGRGKRGVVTYEIRAGASSRPMAKSPEVEPADLWRNRHLAKSPYGNICQTYPWRNCQTYPWRNCQTNRHRTIIRTVNRVDDRRTSFLFVE